MDTPQTVAKTLRFYQDDLYFLMEQLEISKMKQVDFFHEMLNAYREYLTGQASEVLSKSDTKSDMLALLEDMHAETMSQLKDLSDKLCIGFNDTQSLIQLGLNRDPPIEDLKSIAVNEESIESKWNEYKAKFGKIELPPKKLKTGIIRPIDEIKKMTRVELEDYLFTTHFSDMPDEIWDVVFNFDYKKAMREDTRALIYFENFTLFNRHAIQAHLIEERVFHPELVPIDIEWLNEMYTKLGFKERI
jgi:hypothetical protein